MASDHAVERPAPLKEIAGRYQLGELLGRGGMGEVHAGWDTRLERPVAVKTLRADVAVQASARRRFESEARSAARLVHPNVVAVYDSGEDQGIPFMVMELLPGRSLQDEIAAGPMDVGAVRSLASQVLGALGAAHSAGIVHRDIKPANILMTEDGRWKVGDFGIAKSVQMHGADETMTGMVLGTPAYLPPERLFGGEATPAGDLYSLGVILYEALAGRRPFQADSPEGWAAVISAHALEPLRSTRGDVPPAMASAIDRSIARDPAARFSSAAEMAEAMGVRSKGSAGAGAGLAAGAAGAGALAAGAGLAAAGSAAAEGAAGPGGPLSWQEVPPANPAETTAMLAGGGPAATQALPVEHAGAAAAAVPPGSPRASESFAGAGGLGAVWAGRRRGLAAVAGGAAIAAILGISIASAAGGGHSPAKTNATTPATAAPTLPPTTPAPTTVPPPPPGHGHGGDGGGKGGGGGGGDGG